MNKYTFVYGASVTVLAAATTVGFHMMDRYLVTRYPYGTRMKL